MILNIMIFFWLVTCDMYIVYPLTLCIKYACEIRILYYLLFETQEIRMSILHH